MCLAKQGQGISFFIPGLSTFTEFEANQTSELISAPGSSFYKGFTAVALSREEGRDTGNVLKGLILAIAIGTFHFLKRMGSAAFLILLPLKDMVSLKRD